MKKTITIITPLVVSIMILLGVTSCGQGVAQEEYESVIKQLIETESQLSVLQGQLADAKVKELQYDELSAKFEELKKQYDSKPGETGIPAAQYEELQAQYEELQRQDKRTAAELSILEIQHEELKTQCAPCLIPPEDITEEKVEQALFALINEERINYGVDPLAWGKNLYQLAKQNSRHMEETGRYEYSGWAVMQEIHWAAGYNTVDQIVDGALLVWKGNQYQFEHGILSKAIKYCAVGAHKEGDIVYITYMSSDFP